MTNVLIRGTVLGLLAGGMAACATTPGYPIDAAPPSASSAVVAQAAAPVSTPPPTVAPETTPRPAPEPVAAQPLAPVAAPADATSAGAALAAQPRSRPRPLETAPPEIRAKAEPIRYTATGKVIEARKMFRDYQVLKGDHLDAITRDLGVTRAVLVAANHLKNPDALKPGQHLKVPVEKVYVVEAGDTLDAVAQRFGLKPYDLSELNVLPERHHMRAGEQLALPEVFHDHGPVVVSTVRMPGRFSAPGGYTPPSWARNPLTGQPDSRSSAAYPPLSGPSTPALTDGQIMAAGRGRFVWPVRGEILESFGVKDVSRRNDGVDVKAPEGAIVHAAADGDVVYAGDQVPGFGNLVLVKHADGWVTAYAHLGKVSVKMRDSVSQDQEIGQVGQSGGVSEPQLHFEVRYAPNPMEKARPVDPLLVLPQ